MQTQEFRTLTEQHQKTAIAALFLIGVVAAYHWVVRPHVALLAASQRYERAVNRRLETLATVQEDVQSKREELEALRAQRTEGSKGAFEAAEAEDFLRGLQGLCRDAGGIRVSVSYLQGEQLRASAPASEEDLDEEPNDAQTSIGPPVLLARGALIAMQGRFADVVDLIGALQSRREKVWIDRLDISSLPSGRDRIACDLGIMIYVICEKEME